MKASRCAHTIDSYFACDDTDTYISDADLLELRCDCWRRLHKATSVTEYLYRAIADIQLAISHEAENTYRPATLVTLMAESGEHKQSIEALDRLYKENPDNFSLLQIRGQLHLDQFNDIPAALRDFDSLIELL